MAKSSLACRALAEFLGTFILVSAVVDATIGGNPIGALCAASALMIGVYCVGDVSGGHLNPAVSFGVWIMSLVNHTDFKVVDLVVYILAQFLGALVAAFKNAFVWHTAWGGASSNINGSTAILTGAGNMTFAMQGKILGANFTNTMATEGGLVSVGLTECIYTAVLVFVVLSVATCGDEGKGMKNSYFGLAIGFVLAAADTAIGSISMCAINPAVALAIASLDVVFGNLPTQGYTRSWPILMFWYYFLVEMIGAVLGCVIFMICRKHQVGKKNGKPDVVSKFTSEFFGTFVRCLTVMLVSHAPASTIGAVGIASSLMVMIYANGAVSGANFNPAVSLGLLIAGALPVVDFAIYLVAQLLGSIFALLTSWLILREIKTTLVGTDMVAGAAGAAARGGWMAIMTAEGIFTFVLVFTVLNVAVRDTPNQYFGLAIGFVIIVGATSLGSISGGCFNPAVALCLDLGGLLNPAHYRMGWSFVYGLIEFFGAVVAALFYKFISAGKEGAQKNEEQMFDELEEADEDEDEYEDEE